ncbi:MAG: efflux RND transporter permease subunit, partial [Planctomycetota bacterium]
RVRLEGTAKQLTQVQESLLGLAEFARPTLNHLLIAAVPILLGIFAAGFAGFRAIQRRSPAIFYASIGLVTLGLIFALFALGLTTYPELAGARLVWALAVTYLLMCALFDSFTTPFVIMITVPLAVVGGFVGLSIVHEITASNPVMADQNLDVLTMLGFIILIGVVVNNAILIVHQARNLMHSRTDIPEGTPEEDLTKEGHLKPTPAIAEAVRTRIRPVFMSTLTSVGGMLPLVLFPGAGSELYRGLGSVVVGGLICATVFTLVLVPLLYSLALDCTEGIRAAFTRSSSETASPTTAATTA